jgi:hypothetical protein
MMAQIHQLRRPVDPDVVEYLQRALDEAKAGEITGVMILAQDPDGVRYGLAGIKDRFAVIGWLSHAMHKLQADA